MCLAWDLSLGIHVFRMLSSSVLSSSNATITPSAAAMAALATVGSKPWVDGLAGSRVSGNEESSASLP
eukprot:scaffold59132_cov56-Phaeocystis_antarctica.AAC.2